MRPEDALAYKFLQSQRRLTSSTTHTDKMLAPWGFHGYFLGRGLTNIRV